MYVVESRRRWEGNIGICLSEINSLNHDKVIPVDACKVILLLLLGSLLLLPLLLLPHCIFSPLFCPLQNVEPILDIAPQLLNSLLLGLRSIPSHATLLEYDGVLIYHMLEEIVEGVIRDKKLKLRILSLALH